MNPERLVYCLMNRSRSLYSYAKNILEDIGYKGYNIKIFFLLILTILIKTPFDSDFTWNSDKVRGGEAEICRKVISTFNRLKMKIYTKTNFFMTEMQ